jgi:thioredoxin reductase
MSTDVLVIGAGPFGLSISAHLRRQGVEHQIVGKPVDTWRAHMPTGMMLRSEPYGSDMSAPDGAAYDVESYSRIHNVEYVKRLGPLSLAHWLDYADWFTEQLVPDIRDITVTSVAPTADGFRVEFADAEPLVARQVVVATGVLPYRVMPEQLTGLPADLVTHTADHHDLGRFQGRSVAVVGSGQSATETAALLHEAGANTVMVYRSRGINWLERNPETISGLGHLRRPVNKLCEGWHCQFWNTPAAFRRLPESVRIDKARSVLGPAGAWWLKDRVQGVVEMLPQHQLQGAVQQGDGIRLNLSGGSRQTLDVDHVVAGTGFRIDVERLGFLSPRLRSSITTLNKYPVLDRAGESSVPGLYFAGAPAAVSNGPSVRFIAGTHTSVPQLTKAIARRARTTERSAAVEPAPAIQVPDAA